jgi:hypothetical protein
VNKITVFFIFILLIAEVEGQNKIHNQILDQPISTVQDSMSITKFLEQLHNLHGINFAFDPTLFPVDSVININYKNQPLRQVLYNIFYHYQPNIQEIQGQVIISAYKRETAIHDYILIQGNIVCAENQKPLPLTNIAIKHQPLGTTSNYEGNYRFLIPKQYIDSTLSFSSIGYKTFTCTVPKHDTTIDIAMVTESIKLKEIEVKYMKADDIIQQTLKNRTQNYFANPLLLTAFFREAIKQDGKYIEVSEAVLDIYKSSYLKPYDKEKVKFVKGRKKVDYDEISVARLKLAGGPSLFSQIDIVKHMDFFNAENKLRYTYSYLEKGFEHDQSIYIIEFCPIIEETDNIYYEGKLHISAQNFAVISADFKMTKKTLRNSEQYLIRKSTKKIKSVPVFTQYHIDYRPYKDKWLLNSVRGKVKIIMLDKKEKTKSLYEFTSELLITNAEKGKGQKIKYSEAFKSFYVLADKINSYDPEYWKNYNIISPEEDLTHVFKSTPIQINVIPKIEKTKP